MMPRAALLATLATLAFAAPALAGGDPFPAYGRHIHRHPPARLPPPEMRYRDPRFVQPPPRARVFGPPPVLIEAYLPRHTERPMYNEPPPRRPVY